MKSKSVFRAPVARVTSFRELFHVEFFRRGAACVVYCRGHGRDPVAADAPPAFIAGAADDEYQPQDPILLYNAWRQAGASVELHLYERGGHGFNLHPNGTTSDHWFDEFIWWMQAHGLLDQARG
ncbi:alpha/beta hydrolase [Xanthomonas sacchari]|uniref:alpha/beta hydrolase n=1 Tax=Xanthomonas sacchari TaxID=56458 RepID=UPI00225374C7|nr:hypothetical protein [Xanthomonas sacchari]